MSALLLRPHDAVLWSPLFAGGCALLDSCAAGPVVLNQVSACARLP